MLHVKHKQFKNVSFSLFTGVTLVAICSHQSCEEFDFCQSVYRATWRKRCCWSFFRDVVLLPAFCKQNSRNLPQAERAGQAGAVHLFGDSWFECHLEFSRWILKIGQRGYVQLFWDSHCTDLSGYLRINFQRLYNTILVFSFSPVLCFFKFHCSWTSDWESEIAFSTTMDMCTSFSVEPFSPSPSRGNRALENEKKDQDNKDSLQFSLINFARKTQSFCLAEMLDSSRLQVAGNTFGVEHRLS